MPRPLLLLLGDSITELGADWQAGGWVSRLLQRFARSADIAQRGMSGYSTQWFMDLVVPTLADDLSTTLRPQLITLWLGANDAALVDGPSAGQHVPLERYTANLRSLVALFQAKAPQAHVLLLTPAPVDDEERRRRQPGGLLDRSNAAAGEYARACVAVGQEMGVPVLDVYTLFTTLRPGQAWRSLLVDGLHLSSEGNALVERLITGAVAAKFPALYTQLQQLEFPRWDAPPPRTAPAVEEVLGSVRPARALVLRRETEVTATGTITTRDNGVDALGGLLAPLVLVCVAALLAVVARRTRRASGSGSALPPRQGLQEGERLLTTTARAQDTRTVG